MEIQIEDKKYKVAECFGNPIKLDSGLIPCKDENDIDVFLFQKETGELLKVRGLWD